MKPPRFPGKDLGGGIALRPYEPAGGREAETRRAHLALAANLSLLPREAAGGEKGRGAMLTGNLSLMPGEPAWGGRGFVWGSRPLPARLAGTHRLSG